MPKGPNNDDPALALSTQNRALSEEKRLNVFLDQIIEAETARNQASDKIKMLCKVIGQQGFNVEDARRKLVQRICAG